MSAVHYTVIDNLRFSWTSEDDFTLSYPQNTNGVVEKIIQSGKDGVTATCIWGEAPTGINVYKQGKEDTKKIYDFSGKCLENLQHGVNIIKETNGKTHKVIVR